MKKFTKVSLVGLAITTLASVVGCKSGGDTPTENNGYTNNPKTGEVVSPDSIHYVEGTTHESRSVKTDKVFATKDLVCDYQIYLQADEQIYTTCGEFIRTHVANATNVDMPKCLVAGNREFNELEKAIYIGCASQFEVAGLKAYDDIGVSGYYILSKGNSVFLMANSYDAYSLAAINFLDKVIGYDALCYNSYVYTKMMDGNKIAYMYDFDEHEIPDYRYRVPPGYNDGPYQYASGQTASPFISESNFNWIHNVYSLMGKYKTDHPEWFDEKKGTDPVTGGDTYNLCYLAHGNAESRKLMITTCADELIKKMANHPDKSVISLTAEDTPYYCTCDACNASIAKYYSEGGSIVQFLNEVEPIINAYIADDGSYKGGVPRISHDLMPTDFDYTLVFFAYHNTVKAPANWDAAKGCYVPIDDSVKCGKHIGVFMAPSNGRFVYSFYDERNAIPAGQIRAWSSCTDRFLAYCYSINFRGYTYPFNSWHTTVENNKFFYENNAIYMFDSCSYENVQQPAFQEMKKYLMMKSVINVNFDANAAMQKFFKYSYGPAANTMLELFNAERSHLIETSDVNTGKINDNTIVTGALAPTIWPAGKMMNWWGLCKKALEEIAPLKISDPNTYKMAERAIRLESITPRFALLDLHRDYFDASEFKQMALDFKADALDLGIRLAKEHDSSMDIYYDSWGV